MDAGGALDTLRASELRDLVNIHGLLVFRGGHLTADRQRHLTSCFGRIALGADKKPKELYVSNRRRSDAPDGELIFHYDYAYDRNPTEIISMYGYEVDDGATPTLFASSNRVLDTIPTELRNRLDGLEALHACFLDRTAPAEERSVMEVDAIPRGAAGWDAQDWKTTHPLVWKNKHGVPTLFACVQHTVKVLGLPIAESDALLHTLFGHLYDPLNVYAHHWRLDDLVIWNNRTVQHCRPKPNDVVRTLRRFEVLDEDINDLYLAIGRANNFL